MGPNRLEIFQFFPPRPSFSTRIQGIAMRLDFRLEAKADAQGSRARAGRFRTLHNEILTPVFMPVGTQATVKAQLPPSLEEGGAQIVLANTYHLLLRPGPEIFRK